VTFSVRSRRLALLSGFPARIGAGPASLAVELSASPVRDEAEIEATITAFAGESAGGLIVAPDAFINTRRRLIMALAERHRLPAIYGFRQFVTEGALISYHSRFWQLAPFEESGDSCLRTPRILFFYGGTGHQAFSRISTALVASSSESTAT
jgi:hypothetical protein